MSNSESPYQCNFAVAPGRYVKEYMEYYDLSFQEFADRCNCAVENVQEIVIENKPLTQMLAQKIGKVIHIPAHVLMRIEKDYRSRIKPIVKVKEREKKTTPVDQILVPAQQFG